MISQKYIYPSGRFFDSFEHLNKDVTRLDNFYDLFNRISINPANDAFLTDCRLLLVLAEPGYGKSRLLMEMLASEGDTVGKKPLEFKNVKVHDVLSYMKTCKCSRIDSQNRPTYFLDGLDEVGLSELSHFAFELDKILQEDPHIKLVISCRINYFEKISHNFKDIKLKILNLLKFNEDQVIQYLLAKGWTNPQINLLISMIQIPGRQWLIQTPRYLELIAENYKGITSQDLKGLSRNKLFSDVIENRLRHEDRRSNRAEHAIVRAQLGSLALCMQIGQISSLTDAEGIELCKNLSIVNNSKDFDDFCSSTIISRNLGSISFENLAFKEFLAAEKLSSLIKCQKTVFDLAFEPETQALQESWINTLSFLIEQKHEMAKYFIDQLERFPRSVMPVDTFRLFSFLPSTVLSLELKMKLFKNILDYYQWQGIWLDDMAADLLARNFTEQNYSVLNIDFVGKFNDTLERIRCSNIVSLVGTLLKYEKLDDEWQQKLKEILLKIATKDDPMHPQPREWAIRSLSGLKDPAVLDVIGNIDTSLHESVKKSFVELACELIPEDPKLIKILIPLVDKRFFGFDIIFENIKTREMLITALTLLLAPEQIENLFEAISPSSWRENDESHVLVSKIVEFWSKEVGELCIKLLLAIINEEHIYHQPSGNQVLVAIASELRSKRSDAWIEIISQISKEGYSHRIFTYRDVLLALLTKNQLKHLKKVVQDSYLQELLILDMLRAAKQRPHKDNRLLARNIAEIFPEIYQKFKNNNSKVSVENKDEIALEKLREIKSRQNQLKKYKDKKQIHALLIQLFSLVHTHFNLLETVWDKVIKEKIAEQVIDDVLNAIEPKEFSYEPNPKGIDTSFAQNPTIRVFGQAISLAAVLNLDISRFRSKILSFLPHSSGDELIKSLKAIGTISPEEAKNILKIYSAKDSQPYAQRAEHFIFIAKSQNLLSFVPLLVKIVLDEKMQKSVRKDAIRAICQISGTIDQLRELFGKITEARNIDLSILINEHFLIKDRRLYDLRWRMNLIKDAIANLGQDPLTKQLYSLDDLLSPLHEIKSDESKEVFFELFNISLTNANLIGEKVEHPYYIWGLIKTYFINAEFRNPLSEYHRLEQIWEYYRGNKSVHWFYDEISEIKSILVVKIRKPRNVNAIFSIFDKISKFDEHQISDNLSLQLAIKEICIEEIGNWLFTGEGQAFLKMREPELQPILKMKLELEWLKRGFKVDELSIYREVQSADGKKPDYLIQYSVQYGMLGPLVVELKLSDNRDLGSKVELEAKESYKNLERYLRDHPPSRGLLFIVDKKERKRAGLWEKQFSRIKNSYEQIPGIQVAGVSKTVINKFS